MDEEVVVIAHQDPGMDAPASHLAGLTQRVKKETPVVIIMKDVLTTVAPSHDMVVSPGGLNANAACHVLSFDQGRTFVKELHPDPVSLTPFRLTPFRLTPFRTDPVSH